MTTSHHSYSHFQIVGTKQILVRPDGYFIKDRTISSSSDNSSVTNNTASSPPLAIGDANNGSGSTSGNGNSLENGSELILPIAEAQAAGKPLSEAIEEVRIIQSDPCGNQSRLFGLFWFISIQIGYQLITIRLPCTMPPANAHVLSGMRMGLFMERLLSLKRESLPRVL